MTRKQTRRRILKALDKAAAIISAARLQLATDHKLIKPNRPGYQGNAADMLSAIATPKPRKRAGK